MTEKPPQTPATKPRSRFLLPRFSMTTLLIVMVLFAVLGAAIHYGMQAVDAGVHFESMLAILVVLAPPLMLFTLKLALFIVRWSKGNNSRDQ